MGVHLNVWSKAQLLLAISFLLYLPSLSNAQERVCDIAPLGSNWNCPFSAFNAADRLVFKELKLDENLKSAQTQDQAFAALEAAYVKFGNLNDFADWLRAQGFHVGPSIHFSPTSKRDQINALNIIFDAAYWEIFDSFWSFLGRSIRRSYSRTDLSMSFYPSGRFENIKIFWAK